MPRYFFHVYDGRTSLDDEGTELPDVYTAQTEAIRMSGEILRDMGAKFWDGTEWRMEVAGERSQIFFVLHFSAEERSVLTESPFASGSL
jgi:uncharacterized protein DUF6894